MQYKLLTNSNSTVSPLFVPHFNFDKRSIANPDVYPIGGCVHYFFESEVHLADWDFMLRVRVCTV